MAEAIYPQNPSQSIGLQCRYALIITSLNTQAKNIPAELMVSLVNQQLWRPAQGLVYTQQIQNLIYRSRALQILVPHLPAALLPQALEIARNIQDKSARVHALSALATRLPEVLSEVLEVARDIEVISDRIYPLSKLAPYLPTALLPQALEVARGTQGNDYRVRTLRDLASIFISIDKVSRCSPSVVITMRADFLEQVYGYKDCVISSGNRYVFSGNLHLTWISCVSFSRALSQDRYPSFATNL